MELTFPPLEVESSAVFKTKKFHIKDVRVIIDILRSKMYSDSITTVVQEISSNARDANREVGNGHTPIEINSPSQDDLIFSVKDFGPGITPDRMENVFLAYGSSTKRDDNTLTGGFGLGAKSPFAYTDQFIIITTTKENGITTKREYIAFIDDSRIGSMSQISEKVVDEPTGTTIKISVNITDIYKFRQAIDKVCKYWDPIPVVMSKTSFAFDSIKRTHENYSGDDWFFAEHSNKIIALLDGIPYPIKVEKLSDIPNTLLLGIDKIGLVVKFKTGDLMITANREEIDYQKDTRTFLAEKLTAISNHINEKIQDEINSCKRYVEATLLLNSKHSLNPIITPKKWKNATVKTGLRATKEYYFRKAEYEGQNPTKFTTEIVDYECSINENTVFVLSNRATLPRDKLQKYFNDPSNKNKKLIIIMPHDKSYVFQPHIIDIADINLQDIKADAKSKTKLLGVKCGKLVKFGSKIEKVVIDLNMGGYYIQSSKSDSVIVSGNNKRVSDVTYVMGKIKIDEVYVFNDATINTLPSNWKSLYSVVVEATKAYLANKENIKFLNNANFHRNNRYNWNETVQLVSQYIINKKSSFLKYAKYCKRVVKQPTDVDTMQTLMGFVGHEINYEKSKINKLHNIIEELYSPVLEYHTSIENIAKYINIIDHIRHTNKGANNANIS